MKKNQLFSSILIGIFIVISTQFSKAQSGCIKIDRILVAACQGGNQFQEGYNEMLAFSTSSNSLNIYSMTVDWPGKAVNVGYTWLGAIQDGTTASKVSELNSTIKACGYFKEPPGGIIPPNSKVLLVTGYNVSSVFNSFAGVTDTIYIIFQNNPGLQTAGHFLNYTASPGGILGPDAMTVTIDFGGGCSANATYLRTQLITTQGIQGNEPGATVVFDANGNASYINNGCQGAFAPFSAAWTNPSPLCPNSPSLNMNQFLTGTKGGKWSGPGITKDSILSVNGLSGEISIKYSVTKSGGCSVDSTQKIRIELPTITGDSLKNYCTGKPLPLLTATGSAGTTVRWFTDAQLTNQVGSGASYQPTSGQTILYAAAFASTCNSQPLKVRLNALPLPNATASNTGPYCESATILLSSSGGTAYSWTFPNNTKVNNQNPQIPLATKSMSGIYTVTVTDKNGCTNTASTTVSVTSKPTVTASNTGPYCPGATISLNSTTSTGITFSWSGPNGYSSTDKNPTISNSTPDMAGTYTVTASAGVNCSANASTTVSITNVTKPVGDPVVGICPGGPIPQLKVTSNAGTTVKWYSDAQLNNEIATGLTYQPNIVQTDFYVIAILGSCKSEALKITLKPSPLPTIIASNKGKYCQGDQITLTATGGKTYTWSGPNNFTSIQQNPTISNASASNNGVYTVISKDSLGCQNTDTTALIVNSLPNPIASNNGPYCAGSPIVFTASGGNTYSWSGPNDYKSNQQNPNIPNSKPEMAGVYTVKATDLNGCSNTATTNVIIKGQVTAEINATPESGESPLKSKISKNSVNEDKCAWFLNDSLIQFTDPGELTFTETGKYTIKLICSNSTGCADTSTKVIEVLPKYKLDIPNVFNPNAIFTDNKVFKVRHEAVKTFQGIIFNRWGTKLYEWNDVNGFWDGKINGADPIDGVYFYVINTTSNKGENFDYKGTVQIITSN